MQNEILSEEELAELTGYKIRGHQRRWLNDRNWLFVESRGGRPLVGRQYVRMKLGAPFEAASLTPPPPATSAWTPDISKVR
ncbi:DUF4224 domain-containing protein [Pseudomonas mosselii]|uniref:DUF4224 domain-containing protein n=1 Tax=Pseudomonas mosselii TaxID=78327 RepID=UPI0021A53A24|nr:DUF4224 domain-containing protein [Pseudomonas mosselii]UWS65417.1 DUF4224 domain-containing protein [Pseudomonas mosselii]